MFDIIKKFFGFRKSSYNRRVREIVKKINIEGERVQYFSDLELKECTDVFRDRLQSGSSLDDILPEVFAVVREVSKRVLGLRHFDVQLFGGVVLHDGMIAEMLTGEGKTLVATLAAYLNALPGHGVHVVTVNDYLAKRDAYEMGQIYKFLGMTVGCITNDVAESARKAMYSCDIVYGTNNEFVFDYLRDNLKHGYDDLVQAKHNFAIVDEVDSIFIDEGRVPVNISSRIQDAEKIYVKINDIVTKLKSGDYILDNSSKSVTLSDAGGEKVEKMLKETGLIGPIGSLYDIDNMTLVHHVMQSLHAIHVFKKDVDYIKKDDRILIVDEFSGRILKDRRYSEGLHQAIEAKEGVKIQNENKILASITFQNYFRMYSKLSGMTGTAITEAAEFRDIYRLEVIQIPTNKPVLRVDCEDEVYRTEAEKFEKLVDEVEKYHNDMVPILIGTTSIEKSEHVSRLLKKRKIKHNVLNAKNHAAEALIVSQAGRLGAVTVATNMAGRGTDIVLGGKPENPEGITEDVICKIEEDRNLIKQKGGAYVIGSERHSARRIDNQLRGRVGRQGDPGRSKFFLSLQDDLMQFFGSSKIGEFLQKMGLKDGEAITHRWITKAVEKAQHRLESKNYEIRKSLLQYDDVVNKQRQVVYSKRLQVMKNPSILSEELYDMLRNVNSKLVDDAVMTSKVVDDMFLEKTKSEVIKIYTLHINTDFLDNAVSFEDVLERVNFNTQEFIKSKQQQYEKEVFEDILKSIFLISIDYLWMDHINTLETLRSGINLRAYSQRDPLSEYSAEAFKLFQGMLLELQMFIIQRFAYLSDRSAKNDANQGVQGVQQNPQGNTANIRRNTACYCNSGKKYKHCHGAL